jgi:cysteinyl-tRNA synthetase
MAKKYLGPSIDIHMGGVEHIPIHHTNEIAQSEAANGVPFVRYWIHNEHLIVDNEKMAKSQGTGFSLSEVIDKGFDPLVLRYLFLTAHYRTRQNFTWDALAGAQKALIDLRGMVASWKEGARMQLSEEKLGKIDDMRKKFNEALENDLNVPAALAVVWEMAKSNIPSGDKYDLILDFDRVLGLKLNEQCIMNNAQYEIPSQIKELVDKRNQLRSEKKFSESDEVRKQIEASGYLLEDTAQGTTVKRI